MSCKQFLQFIRKKCSQCFAFSTKKNRGLQSMLENSESKKLHQSYQMTVYKQNNKQTLAKFVSEKIRQPINQDEFYSIDEVPNSKGLKNTKNNKKKTLQLPRLQKKSLTYSYTNQNQKSQQLTSGQWEDTPIVQQQRFNLSQQLERLKDWLKKQYGKAKLVSFRVNHAVRLRMQGQGMLTLLMHKLQDFKIKFSQENTTYLNPTFQNRSKTLNLRYQKQEMGLIGYKKIKYLKYYEINTYTTTLQPLFMALFSKDAMNIMNGFNQIQLVKYEGQFLKISLPILKVKQNSSATKSQKHFHLATQICELTQTSSQQKQIILISYSLDESQENWQCLVRITFGYITRIQIYSECFEEQSRQKQQSFRSRFDRLQKYLCDLKLIPAN